MAPNFTTVNPSLKIVACVVDRIFQRLATTFSPIASALLCNSIMRWSFPLPFWIWVGPVTVLTNRIEQKCKSDAAPILGVHFEWPGSFCILPLGRCLGLPHLEPSRHAVRSANEGEAMYRVTSQQSQMSSQPTCSTSCQPCEPSSWASSPVERSDDWLKSHDKP